MPFGATNLVPVTIAVIALTVKLGKVRGEDTSKRQEIVQRRKGQMLHW